MLESKNNVLRNNWNFAQEMPQILNLLYICIPEYVIKDLSCGIHIMSSLVRLANQICARMYP